MTQTIPSRRSNGASTRRTLFRIWTALLAIALLLIAGAKLYSLTRGQPFLHQPDPILRLPNRIVLAIAAGAEIAAAAVALRRRSSPRLRAAALGWIGSVAGIYRWTHWTLAIPAPCPCLGSVAGAWPWLARHQDPLLLTVIALLLITVPLSLMQNQNQEPNQGEQP